MLAHPNIPSPPFLILPNIPPYTPFTRPRPFKFPMACPFDQASDRHSTPSTSSTSSHESSNLSFPASPVGFSSHLPRDIGNLHLACPNSQPLGHSDPVIKLGRMAERDQGVEDDAMMLDDWEEEGKRGERGHGKQESYSVSIFFSISGTLGLLN